MLTFLNQLLRSAAVHRGDLAVLIQIVEVLIALRAHEDDMNASEIASLGDGHFVLSDRPLGHDHQAVEGIQLLVPKLSLIIQLLATDELT